MASQIAENPPTPATRTAPPDRMRIAVDALAEVCGTMFMIDLEPSGEVVQLEHEGLVYGGCVTLLHGAGSWELGLFGAANSGAGLARAISGMKPDETPPDEEVVDALAEITNILAGTVKTTLGKRSGGDIHITPPLFLLGKDCREHLPISIPTHAQAYSSSQFDGLIHFAWTERTPAALLDEIAAVLDTCDPQDKLGLTEVISLFQELLDSLGDLAPEISECVGDCEALLTDLVNTDDSRAAAAGTLWTREALDVLRSVVIGGADAGRLADLPPAPSLEGAGAEAAGADAEQPTPIERDDDTLEMFSDFLQESADGMENADATLMEVENAGAASDPDAVDRLFRIYHTIKGLSGFLELNEITSLAHTTETLMAKVRDGDFQLAGPILDLVFESTEAMQLLLGKVRDAVEAGTTIPRHPPLAQLLARLEAAIAGEAIPEKTAAAEARPQATAEAAAPKKSKIKETLKIDAELVGNLDQIVGQLSELEPLVRQAGELVTASSAEVAAAMQRVVALSAEFRTVSAKMRMVSLASVFQKMARMVRDLAKKTEKLAKVTVEGEDTLVARGMVDKISDPLIHLVRNAVDHGIEGQDERRDSGKPMLATIRLHAHHEGNRVVVEISEDGRGLDPAKLIDKARDKGLIADGALLSSAEAYQLIFAPGFSTKEQVTAISGRGVGMDVVKRNVETMKGELVVDSKLGSGTTFRMILPLVPDAQAS